MDMRGYPSKCAGNRNSSVVNEAPELEMRFREARNGVIMRLHRLIPLGNDELLLYVFGDVNDDRPGRPEVARKKASWTIRGMLFPSRTR
ncbi:hypothetical protein MRB53_027480 [Persea americana]|uniref:Uncharacterized protein n=1 Tax=Persea americana TaxID=3435 RepID=A0ACC2LL41_PERAE|nr:hypothetical protein MRB53_027480 [Persea americana]